MVQVVNLRRHAGIFCGNPLGRRHQFRAHGAGKGYQDLHMRRFQGPYPTKDFFIQSLSRSGRVIKPQHKGCKLVSAGYPVERKTCPCAICPAYPHAGAVFHLFTAHFQRELIRQRAKFFHISLQLRRQGRIVQIELQLQRGSHLLKYRLQLGQHIRSEQPSRLPAVLRSCRGLF